CARGIGRRTPRPVSIRSGRENCEKYLPLAAAAADRRTKAERHPHEMRNGVGLLLPYLGLQKIADEALATAALVTPIAPTRTRLSAQTTSRLNQLFEMNLNPSHSRTARATNPPLTIIAVAWTSETTIAVHKFPRISAAAAWWPVSCSPALQILR